MPLPPYLQFSLFFCFASCFCSRCYVQFTLCFLFFHVLDFRSCFVFAVLFYCCSSIIFYVVFFFLSTAPILRFVFVCIRPQCFLPQDEVHDAKKKKIVNCGVVAFTLARSGLNETLPETKTKKVFEKNAKTIDERQFLKRIKKTPQL